MKTHSHPFAVLLCNIMVPLLLCFVAPTSSAALGAPNVEKQSLSTLLDTLDHAINHYNNYAGQKMARIVTLRRQLSQKQQPADRYAVQTLLYDEYYVFDADSAMTLCDRQLAIARSLHNEEWEAEWHIKRSFVMAAMGLLGDANDELAFVEGRAHLLPIPIRTEYYRQKIYIHSHEVQYLGRSAGATDVTTNSIETSAALQALYNDSILQVVSKTDPLYLWQMAWGPDFAKVQDALEKAVMRSSLDSRHEAMNAYSLAHIYDMEGCHDDRMKMLVRSAIADVRYCNHDIASLEELSRLLFDQGDLRRAYDYINFCLARDLEFHNRVRVVSTSETFSMIHEANVQHQHRQYIWLMVGLALLIVLSAALALVIVQLVSRVRRSRREEQALAEANRQQEQANAELQKVNAQLQDMITRVDQANGELSDVNGRLSEVNGELRESNYVKEETIGLAFTLCSGYITRMEEQRKTLARLLKTNQSDLLRRQLETSQSSQQLKDFFRHFDQLFLNIYPDFIEDFNGLLRPEERLQPKESDLLNTELRIYALVRLGINDSVKIAEFLHCSPQTVYNYRLRVRNKSDIPNSEFAATVQRLGKAML